MRTRGYFNILKKMFLFIFMVVCSTTMSFASVNSLSGIDVKEVGNDNYNIMLKVENFADVQKIRNEKDNLTILLNSTIPTDSVEIVYDNATDLENVIVQKRKNDSTIILLQGKNIENANIYTKELATGLTTQKNVNENLLNNYFFIIDKKLTFFSILGCMMFFLFMLALRPKSKRYSSKQLNTKNTRVNKKVTVNSLRNKNLNTARHIPSINYRINGSARASMTMPRDFVINNYLQAETQEIRKAG